MLAFVPSLVCLWGGLGLLSDPFLADWVRPFMAGVSVLSLIMTLSAFWPPLQAFIKRLFETPVLALLILLALWGAWVRGVWATRVDQLPPPLFYVPFSLLWPWAIIAYLWAITDRAKHRMGLLIRLVLQATVSLAIILLMLEILLRLVANRLPPALVARSVFLEVDGGVLPAPENTIMMPPQAPVRRYRFAGQTYEYTLYNTDGDLFRVSCLEPPSEKIALYDVRVTYNVQGFRESTDGPAPLFVIGDSFTMAGWTKEPYWMGLYSDVVAAGIPGAGSLEQAMLLEAFGPERQPEVVLMAYFEGNDLQETWRFSQAVELYEQNALGSRTTLEIYPQFRPLRFLSAYAAALWLIDQFDVLQESVYGDCPYPMTDAYGNRMSFYDNYVAMSTVDKATLAESEIFARTTEAIRRAADQAKAMDAAFVLMFIPTTFHAHWEALDEAGLIPQFAEFIRPFEITPTGFVPENNVSPREVEARLRANVDNQRTLLADFAAREGLLFLDLTEPFQALVAEGRTPYSDVDTHWRDDAHPVIRELIRAFLQAQGLLETEQK
jgi:hypothetical protein